MIARIGAVAALVGAVVLPRATFKAPLGLRTQPTPLRQAVWNATRFYDLDPELVAAAIELESAGKWQPGWYTKVRFGLFQWDNKTAPLVGAKPTQTGVEQVWLVCRWIRDRWEQTNPPITPQTARPVDYWLAALAPAALGRASDFAIYMSPTAAYESNKGADVDGDGTITVGDTQAFFARLRAADRWAVTSVDAWPVTRGFLLAAASWAAAAATTTRW